MVYAPIGLTVYSRLNHLKQAVEYLQKNTLANESDIFIFSDGPKPGDEDKVDQVRQFIHTVDGFRSVKVIERENNSRVDNNRGGAKYLLKNFGKMIWLAEDVLCAPGFLAFANECLEKYRDVKEVNSISGYVEPFKKPSGYPYDAFFTRRFNGWGFAIWEDRYLKLPAVIYKDEYYTLINNKSLMNDFKYYVGEDALNMIRLDMERKIDALDVRIMFQQFMQNKVTVRPVKSLTATIGHDGSGTHCHKTNRFDVETWDKVDNFHFPEEISINKAFAKSLSNFRRIKPIRRRLYNIMRGIFNVIINQRKDL